MTKKFWGKPDGHAWVWSEPRISKFGSYYRKLLKIFEVLTIRYAFRTT